MSTEAFTSMHTSGRSVYFRVLRVSDSYVFDFGDGGWKGSFVLCTNPKLVATENNAFGDADESLYAASYDVSNMQSGATPINVLMQAIDDLATDEVISTSEIWIAGGAISAPPGGALVGEWGAVLGQMTRDEIVVMSKSYLGRTGDTGITDVMNDLLNLFQQELAQIHPWTCLSVERTGSFTVGVWDYAWEDQVNTIHSFRLTGDDRRILRPLSPGHADEMYPDIGELDNGMPVRYVNRGYNYQIIPPPDSEYAWKQHYTKWADDMSTGGAVSNLKFMDMILVYGLCMHTAMALGEPEDHSKYAAIIYSDARTGTTKRGLIHRAILQDKRRSEKRLVKRPFVVEETGEARPADYLTNPRIGL